MAAAGRAIGAAYEPKRFGAYWLLDPIADSRFGIVYRACLRRGRLADKLLAIKRASPELSADPGFAERFLEVIGAAARLRHPSHCAIEDVGRSDGALYMAMEWVPGVDLARVVARLRQRELSMPLPLVLYVGSQIAAALAAAHRATRAGGPAPLFHGELAPSNILIGYDGRVKLTGIGSAALLASAPQLALRASYRGPELAHGAAYSASSDVFSLGACLYELLSGEPYAGAEDDGLARPGQSRPRSSIRRRIPQPLEPVVSRALAEQPALRWANAAELGRALDRLATTHGPRASAGTLGAFLLAHFDAERNASTTRLQALLAMLGPVSRAPSSSTRQRAVSSEPSPSAAPPASAGAGEAGPFDPAERTPPRGNVMQELAARMRAEQGPAQRVASSHDAEAEAESIAVDVATDPEPVVPAVVRPPALESRAESETAQGWEDEEPAPMWISSSEERATAGPSRTTGDSWAIPLSQGQGQSQGQRPTPVRRAAAAPRPMAVVPSAPTSYPAPPPSLALKLGLIVSGTLLIGLGALALWPSAPPTDAARAARPAPVQRPAPSAVARSQPKLAPGAPVASPSGLGAPVERVTEPSSTQSDDPRMARDRRPTSEPAPAADDEPAQPPAPGASSDDPLAELDQDDSAPAPGTPSVFQLTPAPGALAEPAAIPAEAEIADPPPAPPAAAPTPARASPAPSAAAAAASSAGPSREAVLIEQVAPKFPSRARRLDVLEGSVSVEYTIDRTGAVQDASILESNPAGVFDEAALRAIQRWRYQPKLTDGKPVESRKRFRFTFR